MLLIVSLDSESLPWLEEQMASGALPNLAHLARVGTKLPLEAAALAGIAYPTLYSGLRTADIGLYFPVQWQAREQRVLPWSSFASPQSLFERIDESGRKIVVLDPPECVPFPLKHGFCMSGLQFRARVLLHPWSTDGNRARRLFRQLGPSARADEVFGDPAISEIRQLRRTLVAAPARLSAAALQALRDDSPDCLWLNCCAMHIAAHQFFNLSRTKSVIDVAEFRDTRLEVAKGYDAMLGSLMGALPAGSDAVIFFAKGMVPARGWVDLLPQMLRRVLREPEREQPISLLRTLIPTRVRRLLADSLPEAKALELMANFWTPRADWSVTRAFCLPSDSPGFIRLNLRDREREGTVAASERTALIQEIRDGLRTFLDSDGEPVVSAILPAEEVVGSGSQLGEFPDLIVYWTSKPTLLGAGVRSSKFGEVKRTHETLGRSGHHGPGAMAICVPGKSALRPVELPVKIEDIPATLLSSLGLEADVPGRSLLATA